MKLTAKILVPILAASISQLVQAVPFTSAANGLWSAASSWDLVLVPDTYTAGDFVNIINFTIDYDSGTTLAGGGLGIANGGTLTIDGVGSVLTQTASTQAIQIGEGSGGPGTGMGTLTIQNGGAMNTGAASGLAVGSGGVNGNGQLDILNGSLTLGAGATAGTGLGVGIGGATGVLNVGSAGSLTTTGEFNIGVGSGSVGTATINGTASTGQISVGRNGGTGALTISGAGSSVVTTGNNASVIIGNGGTGDLYISGGSLTVGSANNSNLEVGNGAGSLGHVHQTGGTISYGSWVSMGLGSNTATAIWDISGGNITSSAGFEVGSDGIGTMNISGTASIATNGYNLGLRNGSLGTVNMTGGAIASTGQVVIGGGQTAGTGVFNVSAGTVSSASETRVGQGTGATGTLNISGTTNWTSGGELQVGNDAGTGTMNMSGGTVTINQWGAIGRNGGTGTLNLSGGTIQMGGANRTFDIGVFGGNGNPFGTGTMNQTGGTLINTVNQTTIGRDASGVGIWNISAGTATLTGQNLVVGNSGNGTLNLSGTGSITGINQLNVAANGGSTGLANINFASPAGVLAQRELFIGNGGGGSGVVNILKGTLQTNEWVEIGRNGGTGTLNVSGPDARWERGTLAGGMAKDVQIGYNGGNGTVNVSNGGTVNHNWWFNVARGAGSVGQISVDGAGSTITQTNGQFNVGEDGTGSLIITNGGLVTTPNNEFTVARNNNSTGTVNIASGGKLHLGDRAFIGRSGGATGTLNVSGAGSEVTAFVGGGNDFFRVASGGATGNVNVIAGATLHTNGGWFTVGENDNSVGAALVSGAGSTLHSNGLIVGWNGSAVGTLTIDNNAVVTNVGHEVSIGRDNANTQGTININSGGILNAGNDLRVGNNGIAHLNLNGGTLNSNGGWAIVGDGGSSNGFVTMTGASVFNHPNDSLMIGNNPGAHGTWTQSGTSVTTIGNELNIGRNGGIGVVNVNGGVFQTNGWTTIGRDGNNGTGVINVTNGGEYRHQTGNNGDFLLGWTNGSSGAVNVNTGGTVNYSWWTRVAVDGGSTGAITVDGATSNWNNTGGRVFIGESGNGTLTITNGGHFTHTNADWFIAGGNDGANSKGSGVVSISGAGSTLSTNNFMAYGRGRVDALNRATGTLNVTAGSVSANQWIGFGANGGVGVANVSGGTVTSGTETIFGADPVSNGTLNLSGTGVWTTGGEFQVGNNGGTGVANISGGTLNLLGYLAIGRNTNNNAGLNGGNGTVNLSGTGVIQKVSGGGSFDIGSWNGGNNATTNTSGTLSQTGGSVVIGNNTSVYVGRDSGVVGNWNITGGTVSAMAGEFRVHNSGGAANDVMSVGGSGAFSLTAANNSAIGQGAGLGTGTLNITNPNAAFTFNSEFWVGNDSGNGTMNMSAGSITANSWFDLGRSSATGVVNFSGGTITKLTGTGSVDIGSSGTGSGTLNESGTASLVNTAADTYVGRENTSVGVWNMNGGTATLAQVMLARDGGTTGSWNVSNGAATLTRLNVGNSGVGTLNISGGSISASDRVSIATNGGSTGTANLNGGVITTQFVEAGGGTATLTMNGGTLRAFGNEGDFLRGFTNSGGHSAVNLAGAGGTIDTNGFIVGLTAGNILNGTSLTKAGNGVLNINATQTYSSLTTNGGVTNIYTALGTGTSSIVANATTNIYTNQTLASLTIADGVEVTFGNGLPFADEPVKPAASFGGGAPGMVPEPASLGLLVVGALGLLARRRRSS